MLAEAAPPRRSPFFSVANANDPHFPMPPMATFVVRHSHSPWISKTAGTSAVQGGPGLPGKWSKPPICKSQSVQGIIFRVYIIMWCSETSCSYVSRTSHVPRVNSSRLGAQVVQALGSRVRGGTWLIVLEWFALCDWWSGGRGGTCGVFSVRRYVPIS